MQLELTSAEREQLLRVLGSYLRETKSEVRRTDTPSFHDELVAERDLLVGLISKIEQLSE